MTGSPPQGLGSQARGRRVHMTHHQTIAKVPRMKWTIVNLTNAQNARI